MWTSKWIYWIANKLELIIIWHFTHQENWGLIYIDYYGMALINWLGIWMKTCIWNGPIAGLSHMLWLDMEIDTTTYFTDLELGMKWAGIILIHLLYIWTSNCCCTLQMLVKILIFHIFHTEKQKKEKKARNLLIFF